MGRELTDASGFAWVISETEMLLSGLAEFRSGKNSQTISVHAVANHLAPRKFFNQRSLCSTHNMILSWNMVENHVGHISRVN